MGLGCNISLSDGQFAAKPGRGLHRFRLEQVAGDRNRRPRDVTRPTSLYMRLCRLRCL